ncbi:hypothetical protein [Fodinibius salinus]|nr:hypothetical protein [Fodinibius salinus]
MSELTEKQIKLLDLLEEDEKLQFYTFERIEGLKWFDELQKRGFLDPERNPEPVPGDKEGFYSIPTWDVLKYLLKTSSQLSEAENDEYIGKYLDFIKAVTLETYEKVPLKRNFRTWWYFAQILSNIPPLYIKKEFIEEIISKWFEDTFDNGLIVDELGNNLLINLIDSDRKDTAHSLFELLVEIKANEESKYQAEKFSFLGDDYQVKKVLENNLEDLAKLGLDAVKTLETKLDFIFDKSDEDLYSNIWRPAIEDHEQNEVGFQKAKNLLIASIRDFLTELLESGDVEKVKKHIDALFESERITFKRIAIHQVTQNWDQLHELTHKFLQEDYFNYKYQHEVYRFLQEHFSDLEEDSQNNVIDIISSIDDYTDDEYKLEQIAYNKIKWLSAIKDSNNSDAARLYKECYEVLGKEPSHPDFSSYMESGFVEDKSPISAQDLITYEAKKLVELLNEFEEDKRNWKGPNKRGLANELFKSIKSNPNKFTSNLDDIIKLKDLYLSQLIKAFSSLWNEEMTYNLKKSLNACLQITETRTDLYEKGHSITIRAICKYITEGTKSDDHAFQEDLLPIIDDTLDNLLTNIDTEDDENLSTSDEVNRAINNNKGHAVEALINYSLRKCRLEDKSKGNHREAWDDLKSYYNAELANLENNNFEFHALITRYLPNVIYLSEDWVEKNLDKIFSTANEVNWKAAINGYSYSKYLHSIFEYLVEANHFTKALDEEKLKFESKKRLLEFAGLNYFRAEESDAISSLIKRWNDEELAKLTWFIWTLREKLDDELKAKVLELWDTLYEKLQDKPLKKTLSNLNYWATYLEGINDKSEQYLLQSAPFACLNYNAPYLVEELSRLVNENPDSIAKIYISMLSNCTPDYDKEHIKHIVQVLKESGYNEKVEQINEHYLSKKRDFIATHLEKINDRKL